MSEASSRLRSDQSLKITGSRVASTNAPSNAIANLLRNLKRDIILSMQYVMCLMITTMLIYLPGNERDRG